MRSALCGVIRCHEMSFRSDKILTPVRIITDLSQKDDSISYPQHHNSHYDRHLTKSYSQVTLHCSMTVKCDSGI